MKTKQNLINKVHINSNISKKTIERVVQDFVNELCDAIAAGNDVRIHELGVFKISTRAAHTGHNPATGETIEIPERRIVQLKLNSAIRRKLNGV